MAGPIRNLKLEELSLDLIKKIKRDWFLDYKRQPECKFMATHVYKEWFNKIIAGVMVNKGNNFLVTDDCWLCYNDDLVHYLWVKKGSGVDDRIRFVLKNLVEQAKKEGVKIECSFVCYMLIKEIGKENISFNPFRRFE